MARLYTGQIAPRQSAMGAGGGGGRDAPAFPVRTIPQGNAFARQRIPKADQPHAMFTLYHHPFCPLSRAVRISMGEYGIGAEFIEERLWERRRGFLEINPANTLPVMIVGQTSQVIGVRPILEFLDETKGASLGPRRLPVIRPRPWPTSTGTGCCARTGMGRRECGTGTSRSNGGWPRRRANHSGPNGIWAGRCW